MKTNVTTLLNALIATLGKLLPGFGEIFSEEFAHFEREHENECKLRFAEFQQKQRDAALRNKRSEP